MGFSGRSQTIKIVCEIVCVGVDFFKDTHDQFKIRQLLEVGKQDGRTLCIPTQ